MTTKIGRTRNFNNTATISSAISLNDTTSVTLSSVKSNRIFWAISIPPASAPGLSVQVWLKFQSASTDNDKKGINLSSGDYWEMVTDSIYTGEISAIVESGSEEVYITEY